MANNYYDATGVLILDRVTPVITALFRGFNLDENYPGDGRAYIARISEDNNPSWDDVLEGLIALAAEVGLPAPGMGEEGSGDDSNDNADGEALIEVVLDLLADHFDAGQIEELARLIEHHDFEDEADLDSLFLIATCFNDGHNLAAVQFEGCWHCSKPRLFEFGGEGCFRSREVRLSSSSSTAMQLGNELRDAVVSSDPDAAATLIAKEAQYILAGINDEHFRMQVVHRVAERLLEGAPAHGAP